jgi:hypothetical protein
MPRSPDLAIFVLTTDDRQTDTQTIALPLLCMRENKLYSAVTHDDHYLRTYMYNILSSAILKIIVLKNYVKGI